MSKENARKESKDNRAKETKHFGGYLKVGEVVAEKENKMDQISNVSPLVRGLSNISRSGRFLWCS